MAVASQTFSRTNFREFAFTTDAVAKRVIDHVYSNSPTLAILSGRALGSQFGAQQLNGIGHQDQSGGHAIILRPRLGQHAGAKRGAGPFDTHNVAPDDNVRFAEANWTFYTHGLSVSEHDLEINNDEERISSFLEDQTESTMLALADLIADDFHASSAAANGLTPLNTLIGAADTVQGLSGATYTNYNSRGISARGTAPGSVSFASGSFAAQGLADMRTSFNNASEGMQKPNVSITTYDVHQFYEGSLQPQERFAGAVQTADGSFQSLAFRTVPVIADPKCASGALYHLHVGGNAGINFKTLSGANFTFGEWKPSSNQNAMVRPLKVTGQLCIGDRRLSNKLTGITA